MIAEVKYNSETYLVSDHYQVGAEYLVFGEHDLPKKGVINFIDKNGYINGQHKIYFYPEVPWGSFRIVKKLQ